MPSVLLIGLAVFGLGAIGYAGFDAAGFQGFSAGIAAQSLLVLIVLVWDWFLSASCGYRSDDLSWNRGVGIGMFTTSKPAGDLEDRFRSPSLQRSSGLLAAQDWC